MKFFDHAVIAGGKKESKALLTMRLTHLVLECTFLRGCVKNPTLFESGAIVLHIAERHVGLLPQDVKARARAFTWMFAALSTMEPPIVQRESAEYLERDQPWYEQRLPLVEERIRSRLDELSHRLGDADWLDDAFSAGDLLMVQVLRRLSGSTLLEAYPNLSAYVARGETRPAFQRAFDAQLAVFTDQSSGL